MKNNLECGDLSPLSFRSPNQMDRYKELAPLSEHFREFFRDHQCSECVWTLGPMREVAPWFKVLRFAPGPKTGLWTYVSLGASLLSPAGKKRHEFLLLVAKETARAVELVTMVAHYHHKDFLGLFHTLPIGQPWLESATCNYFFLSLPYPFGEELELFRFAGRSIQTLWLLPITKTEHDYFCSHGVDALEEKFDAAAIEYWQIDRRSVV